MALCGRVAREYDAAATAAIAAFLTPEIALVHVRSELTGDARAPGETFPYRKTILFTTRLQGVDSSR